VRSAALWLIKGRRWRTRAASADAGTWPWNNPPFIDSNTATLTPFTSNPLISHPMSVNHGRIVGQVVHPGLAPERKQKRSSTPHSRLPVPAEDIIEISSDEDEDPQPPPKRTLTKRGHPPPTHEPDYKARLFQKDQEIERLKKVRHQ
jgi:hypothetical protein